MSMKNNDDSALVAVVNQCSTCAHWDRKTPTRCEAFPAGIPLIILLGEYDHTLEFNYDGVSDGGLTYVPFDARFD